MFFINEDAKPVAELTYSLLKKQMIIQHTHVNEALRGGNLGYELLNRAAEYARSHHYTIVPVCKFARAVMEKKPEFKDVLA